MKIDISKFLDEPLVILGDNQVANLTFTFKDNKVRVVCHCDIDDSDVPFEIDYKELTKLREFLKIASLLGNQ